MARSPAPPKALQTRVTYLEMTAPARAHFPLPVNIQVAMMRATNIPLHFYRYLQYRVGRPWYWVYRLRLDDKTLAEAVHDERTQINVLYVEGAPAGFFELFHKDETTVDLCYFGLMQHVHGRGLGKWFLGQAVDAAWAMKPMRVTVNTNTLDHPAALPLYQRIGFEPVGQTDTFIHPLTDQDHMRLARLD